VKQEAERAWQPIETAPKDGTWVLLGGGVWGDDWADDAPRVMSARYEKNVGWLVCAAEAGYSLFPYVAPTHWQPLPAGPAAAPEPAIYNQPSGEGR
jgi:hypothetical protein